MTYTRLFARSHQMLRLSGSLFLMASVYQANTVLNDGCPCEAHSCSSGSAEFNYNASGSGISSDCTPVLDTFDCAAATFSGSQPTAAELPSCDALLGPGVLTVHIQPYTWVHPEKQCYPAVRLNVTVIVARSHTANLSAVQLQFACASSRSPNSDLCSRHADWLDGKPHVIPRHWPTFYWPCRLFNFNATNGGSAPDDTGNDSLGYRVNYSCFKLSDMSTYQLNITLQPSLCRQTYGVSVEHSSPVLPGGEQQSAAATDDWTPVVLVDANSAHAVTVRLMGRPTSPFDYVLLDLFIMSEQLAQASDASDSSSTSTAHQMGVAYATALLPYGNHSIHVFNNLLAGKYTLRVTVVRDGCTEQCVRMLAEFVLLRDRLHPDHRPSLWSSWLTLTTFFVLLLVLLAVGLLVAWYVFERRQRALHQRRQQQVHDVQLTRRIKVLLLYTDDGPEHRRCVRLLADWLDAHASCHVLLDEQCLHNSHVSAMNWLMDSVAAADVYMVVFSQGTRLALQGVAVGTSMPWTDLFPVAITYVMQGLFDECRTRTPTSSQLLRNYVWLRLDYADDSVVDSVLGGLPVAWFSVPSQLHLLVCHLHAVFNDDSVKPVVVNDMQVAELVDAVIAAKAAGPLRLAAAVDDDVSRQQQQQSNLLADVDWQTGDDHLQLGVQQAYHLLAGMQQRRQHHSNGTQQQFALTEPPDDDEPDDDIVNVAVPVVNNNHVDGGDRYALIGSPDQLSDSEDEDEVEH